MKLSYNRRRRGAVHVVPSRLVRVTRTHVVDANIAMFRGAREDLREGDRITVRPGDVALEVAAHRTGKPVAYSYISGDAIQNMVYRSEVDIAWFEPATCARIDVPTPEQHVGEALWKALLCTFISARYGVPGDDPAARPPVAGFRLQVPPEELGKACEAIMRACSYVPDDPEKAPCTTHIIGLLQAGRRRNAEYGLIHVQPPSAAGGHGAAPFAIRGVAQLAQDSPVPAPYSDEPVMPIPCEPQPKEDLN